ncbi:MAG TPA: hypothetical protein VF614_11535 [Chthoniobacteraceae bacterium]|jgi:hypothetical protein
MKKHSLKAGALMAAATIVNLAAGAHAALIVPTAATSSPTGTGYFSASNVIDGSGLANTAGAVSTWTHNAGNYGGSMWNTPDGTNTGQLTFQLGENFDLTQAYIWNGSQGYQAPSLFNRGAKDVNISTSVDGITFTPAQSIAVAAATANPTSTQTFSLTGLAFQNIKAVRFDIVSNHGGNVLNVGEVRFEGNIAVVPEPASLVTLLGGLSMLGMLRPRRRG